MWLNGLILLTLLAIVNCIETELTVEAAFQGHCGRNSPCEQLCYEIHDGMYECDCTEGYELNKNGYSCQELNSTYLQDNNMRSEEDILYQKGVSFSAKLDSNNNISNNNNDFDNNNDIDSNSSSSSGGYNSDNINDDDEDNFIDDNNNYLNNNNDYNNNNAAADDDILDTNLSSEEILNYNQNQLTFNNVPENINNNQQNNDELVIATQKNHILTQTTTLSPTILRPTLIPSISALDLNNLEYYDIYYANKDMSVYDDVNNNKLNLRPVNSDTYQNENHQQQQGNIEKNYHKEFTLTTIPTTTIKSNIEHSTTTVKYSKNNHNNILNSQNDKIVQNNGRSRSSSSSNSNVFDRKLDNKKHINVGNNYSSWNLNSTSGIKEISSSSELIYRMDGKSSDSQKYYVTKPCLLDCGSDGVCDYIGDDDKNMRCLCTFGKTGKFCAEDIKVNIPRFTHKSWLAFPALRGAYKHVQLRVEFRPESFDGIILLTGERDDLTGDFMAILIHQGFIEFWFDCGSGVGSVRSKETVQLNQWNSVTIYRHRWDAWLVLNHGSRVQGRSKGLFSRITFREPVFLGGTGNITGLAKRLPIHDGMIGCIRRFIANEHEYKFTEHPLGDVTKGFDIQDCTTDKCVKYPCQHGGKCLPSDQGAVCLCPLGFGGDLCEMRLDLQVPSFNGSSYLRYSPLGDSALIWLELQIIIKPYQEDGIILYSGHEEYGDYIALSLNMGYIEFAFDLGSGPAIVRSEYPLTMDKWHTIKISRTARLAVLKIDQHSEVMTISSNGFWHLSLPHSLFLGGIHNVQHLPLGLKDKGSFVGCIQKVEINGHSLSIISEALGGTNIDNCPHACVAKPCGPLAQCLPILDSYECRCNPFNAQCNKAEEVSLKQIPLIIIKNNNNNDNNNENDDYKKIEKISLKSKNHQYHHNNNNHQDKLLKNNLNQSIIDEENLKKSNIEIIDEHEVNQQLNQKTSDVYYYDYDELNPPLINNQLNQTKKNILNINNKNFIQNNLNDKIKSDEKLLLLSSSMNHKNIEAVIKSPFSLTTSLPPLPAQPYIIKPKKQIQSNQYISINNNYDDDSLKDNEKNIKNPIEDNKKLSIYNQEVNDKISDDDQHKIDDNDDDGKLEIASMKKAQVDVDNDQFIITTTTTKINRKNHNKLYHSKKHHYHQAHNNHQQHNRKHDNKNHIIGHSEMNSNNKTSKFIDYDNNNYKQTKTVVQQPKQQHHHRREHSTFLVDDDDRQNDYQAKVLIQDMERIMKNGVNDLNSFSKEDDIDDDDDDDSDLIDDDFNLNNQFIKVPIFRKNLGACFTGTDSYFHYNDAETMSQIISYKIDLNLRFKTHSNNGIILWSGRYSALETDDFLSLGIENGYLHFRYNLGSGETNIYINTSKVSDGLWHRVRAMRNSQEGFLEVDGRKSNAQRSPGKLRQLNTDTGLFVGGMNKVTYFTRRRYFTGIVGCISEIILAGELRLNLDPATLGTAHNVETGIL